MIAKYAFNGSIDKITSGFPFAFNAKQNKNGDIDVRTESKREKERVRHRFVCITIWIRQSYRNIVKCCAHSVLHFKQCWQFCMRVFVGFIYVPFYLSFSSSFFALPIFRLFTQLTLVHVQWFDFCRYHFSFENSEHESHTHTLTCPNNVWNRIRSGTGPVWEKTDPERKSLTTLWNNQTKTSTNFKLNMEIFAEFSHVVMFAKILFRNRLTVCCHSLLLRTRVCMCVCDSKPLQHTHTQRELLVSKKFFSWNLFGVFSSYVCWLFHRISFHLEFCVCVWIPLALFLSFRVCEYLFFPLFSHYLSFWSVFSLFILSHSFY